MDGRDRLDSKQDQKKRRALISLPMTEPSVK